MIDERWRGPGDARRILAVRLDHAGTVLVTPPLERVLPPAAEVEVFDGRVEVAP